MHQIQSDSMSPLQRLHELLMEKDFEFTELFNGAIAFSWGLWLIAPWSTFESSPAFIEMQKLAPEWIWGIIVSLFGGIQLTSLILNWWQCRRKSTLIMFISWVYISYLFITSNILSTTTIIYPFLAFSQVWAYLRMRIQNEQY